MHLCVASSLGLNANQLLKELAPAIKGSGTADFVQASAGSMSEVERLVEKLRERNSEN